MKIKGMSIYGFGKWKDYSLQISEDHPSLIVGENEAGKSTIYQFILFMLFGLSPKQRQSFIPKTGGTMGGRLVLSTEAHGKVTIERTHGHENGKAVCHLESGEERDEEWLQSLLDGMERKEYESTYGFNADDLIALRSLSGSELGEVLLNIGLTGSDQIYQTEKWLEKQLDERFKPKGKRPEINEQLQVVEELKRKKKILDEEEGDYLRLQEHQRQLEKRMTTLEEDWKKKMSQIYTIEQLLKVMPVLIDYHQAKALSNQEKISFPESGVDRYQQVKESLLPLQSEINMLGVNLEELQASLKEWKQKYASEKIEQGRKLLEKERPKYDQAVYEDHRLHQQIIKLTEQMEEELAYIDIPLTAKELEEYALPFYIGETWRDLTKEKEELEREEAYIKSQKEEIEHSFEKMEARKQSLENRMITDEKARSLEGKLHQSYESAAASDRKGRNSQSGLKNKRLIGLTGGVITLVLGGFLQGIGLDMELFFVFMLIASIFGVFSYMSHRKIEEMEGEGRVSSISGEEIEKARHELQQYEVNKKEYDHLREQWKQLNQEEIQLQEKENHWLQRHRRLNGAIEEQKSLYPFLTSLQIQHWEKLYHLLTQVKEKRLTLNRLEEERKEQTLTITRIEKELEAFFRSENWEFYIETVGDHWKDLQTWVHDQEQIKKNITQTEKSYHSANKRYKEYTLRMQPFLEQRDNLFKDAGVGSEETFYAKANKKQEQLKNEANSKELERQLQSMLSENEQQEYQIWTEVPQETELLARRERLNMEKRKVEEERKNTQQAIADTSSSIKQLEHSDERSSITHRLQYEQDKLQEQTEEWAMYQLAKKALEKTKHSYKDKYLPQVLQKASDYFQRLTDGNYVDVKLSPDDDQIKVISQGGFVFVPAELSRGTRDQLYVSFRLALGETMAESLSMPFLVDDAFVHFDMKRLPVMVDILQSLSERHQVVLFTWREELSEEFGSPFVRQLS
ncbi:ATP-binding protein [Halobacillus karajensis]|uniref:YhaN AAA domain-containing protein n=1 Tax=Halobacillus karajensis TaxID=195088 RepID=A0A059NY24_9BACI|nr:AAA family ATPase [Halobacillus karajensis]CDQ21118.1 hypothetical protein BN982_03481 [Halobacillus karajensis]CDQ24818.1 hypothetical protein BN983_03117 [Halobacillus karajensis]CDQ28822.1 hypothetical protein BN981_03137 [Halobacillus karajensis]